MILFETFIMSILQVGVAIPETQESLTVENTLKENVDFYNSCKRCIEEMARYLKSAELGEFICKYVIYLYFR